MASKKSNKYIAAVPTHARSKKSTIKSGLFLATQTIIKTKHITIITANIILSIWSPQLLILIKFTKTTKRALLQNINNTTYNIYILIISKLFY